MPYVESSVFRWIEWNDSVLTVCFRDTDRRYEHWHVPEELYLAFLAAPSKGQFYNDFIREDRQSIRPVRRRRR